MAGKALRVLGVAYKDLAMLPRELNSAALEQGLTFVGLIGMIDPPRPEVRTAVEQCYAAGIKPVMITGDHKLTAVAIARELNIYRPGDLALTGEDLDFLPQEVLEQEVEKFSVYARVSPEHKMRIVKAWQARGKVVAMTGDGVNDAPALKAAQVGLSMGDGTSVAKEASDITIIDNSFSSITRAVMWGRSLYRNIQKFLLFQLTINVAACLIVLLGSLLGTESPLTITQMLWVNLIMDTFAAGALASLPPNERVMKDKPRRSGKDGDFIITRPMAYNIFGVGLAFVIVLMGLLLHFHAQDGLTPHDLSWFLDRKSVV